jgi:hypothetical protein
MCCECGRVVQLREEREGRENEREKIFSAGFVWTAILPDNRQELKGTPTRDERKESENDRIKCVDRMNASSTCGRAVLYT